MAIAQFVQIESLMQSYLVDSRHREEIKTGVSLGLCLTTILAQFDKGAILFPLHRPGANQ